MNMKIKDHISTLAWRELLDNRELEINWIFWIVLLHLLVYYVLINS